MHVHRFARLSFSHSEHARSTVDDGCRGIDYCLFSSAIRLFLLALLHQLLYVGLLRDLVLTVCFPVHCPFVCAMCLLSCGTLDLANDEYFSDLALLLAILLSSSRWKG